jgi:hypothetical protein
VGGFSALRLNISLDTKQHACDTLDMKNTVTFEMNGDGYETDAATLDLLRQIVRSGKEANDMSAVAFMMTLGEMGGRIRLLGRA